MIKGCVCPPKDSHTHVCSMLCILAHTGDDRNVDELVNGQTVVKLYNEILISKNT
jgi:hypothetical protein